MKSFPLSELVRNVTTVQHEATRAPVTITDRKKPRFVLMAIEDYESLVARAVDTRRSFMLSEMSEADAAAFLPALDRLIDGGDDG
jgi:prevent-host-death family protein